MVNTRSLLLSTTVEMSAIVCSTLENFHQKTNYFTTFNLDVEFLQNHIKLKKNDFFCYVVLFTK